MAQGICRDIDEFQADAVVPLLHGGRLPVRAAQVLWQSERHTPFPPIVPINLGREKYAAEVLWRCDQGIDPICLSWADADVGHFLNWVDGQQRWQIELRRMVTFATGTGRVQRVLVVDDIVEDSLTATTVLGILRSTFPDVKAQVVAGQRHWRYELPGIWLKRFHPGALTRIKSEESRLPGEDWAHPLRHLDSIALGTEDEEDPMSLDWRTIRAGSPRLQPLLAFLPEQDWLELPAWLQCQIDDWVASCAHRRKWRPFHPNRDFWHISLETTWLICQSIWHNGWSSPEEIARVLSLTEEEARRLLNCLITSEDLIQEGPVYTISPAVFGAPIAVAGLDTELARLLGR